MDISESAKHAMRESSHHVLAGDSAGWAICGWVKVVAWRVGSPFLEFFFDFPGNTADANFGDHFSFFPALKISDGGLIKVSVIEAKDGTGTVDYTPGAIHPVTPSILTDGVWAFFCFNYSVENLRFR